MEKLILLSEDGISEEFPLIEQLTSIGREERNRICLSDKSVSRHHATLQRVFRGFTIQDEGSTNGTRVNGRLITKQFLKHRDLIEVGKYHMRFLVAEPDHQIGDADKTVVIRSARQTEPEVEGEETPPDTLAVEMPAPPEPPPLPESPLSESSPTIAAPETGPEPAEAAAEETESGARVIYMAGDKKGQELAVDRAFFSVGEPGGDLVLINKRHNGYYLLKVGGDVPPNINGIPIKAGGVELRDQDRIDLGVLSLEFRL